MTWEAVGVIAAIVLGLGQFANLFLSLKIHLIVTQQKGELQEWARETFVAKDQQEPCPFTRPQSQGPLRQAAQWEDSVKRVSGAGD